MFVLVRYHEKLLPSLYQLCQRLLNPFIIYWNKILKTQENHTSEFPLHRENIDQTISQHLLNFKMRSFTITREHPIIFITRCNLTI